MTIDDIVKQIIGNIVPDAAAANMITTWVLPWIKNKTGDSIMWDTILGTDKGVQGLFNEYQEKALNTAASNLMLDIRHEFFRDRLVDFNKSILSEDSFKELQKNGKIASGIDYNQYIENKVSGQYGKGMLRALYDQFIAPTDWDKSWTISTNLGKTAYNLTRQGLQESDRNAFVFGKRIASSIFDKDYKPSDWNGFSQAGVSELSAAISENMDFFRYFKPGVQGSEITDVLDKFKRTLKEYTTALEPLKEVMGNDLGNMLKAIEGITGQSITSMNIDTIHDLAKTLTSRTVTGSFTQKEYTTMLTGVTQGLAQLENLNPWNYVSAPRQALQAMDIWKGVEHPDFMSKNMWQAYSKKRVLETNNSKGSELFALSYGVWAENQLANAKEGEKPDVSWEKFEERIRNRMETDNMDSRQAARVEAGALQEYQLLAGAGSRYTRQAIESGAAGRFTREQALAQQTAITGYLIGGRADYVEALISGAAQDKKEQLRNEVFTADKTRSVFNRTIEALKKNTRLSTMTQEEQAVELKRLGYEDIIPYFDKSVNWLKTNESKLISAVFADVGERRSIERAAKHDRMAESIKYIDKELFDPDNGWQSLFKEGWSESRVLNWMRASAGVKQMAALTSTDSEDLFALTTASRMVGSNMRGTDVQKANAYSSAFLHYATDTGFKSEGFGEAFDKYKDAIQKLNDLDKGIGIEQDADADEIHNTYAKYVEQRDTALTLMTAYKEAGADAVNTYMKQTMYNEKGEKLTEAQKISRMSKYLVESNVKGTEQNPTIRFADQLKFAALDAKIRNLDDEENSGIKKQMLDVVARWNATWKDKDKNGIRTFDEGWSDFYATLNDEEKKVANRINSYMLEVDKNAGSAPVSVQDKLLHVLELLERFLKQFLGDQPGAVIPKPQ